MTILPVSIQPAGGGEEVSPLMIHIPHVLCIPLPLPVTFTLPISDLNPTCDLYPQHLDLIPGPWNCLQTLYLTPSPGLWTSE